MAGSLPLSFVPREMEFEALKAKLLAEDASGPVALTAALQGAGGYGKTTLANALCRDDDVRAEFSDGIVLIEIGKERPDAEVLSLVVDVIETLDSDGRRPGFENPDVAAEQLAAAIGGARLLLVIDDVRREAQLRPFLRGGPNCVRLVTTRRRDALPPDAQTVDVDEMQGEEAVAPLSWGLPVAGDPAAAAAISVLARRLEHWPQMMEIANGWLRGRLRDGEPLDRALRRFAKRLDKHRLTGFDPADEVERNRAVGAGVAASLEDLSEEDLARFEELAILPEDEAVPIDVIEDLWARTGEFDEDDADELLRRLRDTSLLQDLDLRARTLQLHDNMVWLLQARMGEARLRQAHRAMADALLARRRAVGTRCRPRRPTPGGSWAVTSVLPATTRPPTRCCWTTTGSARSCEHAGGRSSAPPTRRRGRARPSRSWRGPSRLPRLRWPCDRTNLRGTFMAGCPTLESLPSSPWSLRPKRTRSVGPGHDGPTCLHTGRRSSACSGMRAG